ncbi:MAG: hypothetical protein CVV54_04305 [Synergistetes bacterium HGW-Synergistetes-1]|nr:MAG: hypothetical protein CVV54_04305 [Synergistetes bacterium HGW-Synergistetes-1]
MEETANVQINDQRDFWFVIVDLCVWQDERLSTLEKAVYTALCTFASVEGRTCWPSTSAIAKRTSCSDRSVNRALETLEEHGYLKITRRFKDNARIPSAYSIIGHKATGGCDTVSQGVTTESRKELEPTEPDLKDTLSEGAEAAPDEQETLPLEEEFIKKIPAAMKETVEFLLLKTGRKGLLPEELGPVMALEKIHMPSRIQREITKAAERFNRQGKPLSSLSFEYIFDSLKYQKSSKSARAQPKVTMPTAAENKTWEEQNLAALMAEFGIEGGVENGNGPG